MTAASPEELLLQAHTIQQKVRAADLAATKAGEAEYEADEETAEKWPKCPPTSKNQANSSPASRYSCTSAASPRTNRQWPMPKRSHATKPVPKISTAPREQSWELLDSSFGGMRIYYGGGYDPTQQYIMQVATQQSARSGTRLEEAIGSQLNDVALPVHVTATFELKPPA